MGHGTRRRHFSCVKQNATLTTACWTETAGPRHREGRRGRANTILVATGRFPIVAGIVGTAKPGRWDTSTGVRRPDTGADAKPGPPATGAFIPRWAKGFMSKDECGHASEPELGSIMPARKAESLVVRIAGPTT